MCIYPLFHCLWIEPVILLQIIRKGGVFMIDFTYYYPAILHIDINIIEVTFPDLPGCTSNGATIKEAICRGEKALTLHLQGMEIYSEKIPHPTHHTNLPLQANQQRILIKFSTE